jgi:cytoskeletal protein CcmA (bactofilin family)
LFKRRKPDEPHAADQKPGTQGGPALPGTADPGAFPRDGAPTRGPDTGLGVPPFRPAPPKEAQMNRAPFPASPSPGQQTPVPGPRDLGAPRPGQTPAGCREPTERRTLVVGRGISVNGVVTDAERLVVEGTVEATMIHATELSISPGGVFKGEVEVEEAEVAGTIDGTLTARASLVVRSTGRVLGTARCRRLQVEDGGQITGRIEMITEATPRTADTPRTTEPAA